jgi:hypothetical protein
MLKTSKYAVGIGMLILGIVFVAINYFTITYEQMYLPKLLLAGCIIGFMGLGLILFPGPATDLKDSSGYWKKLWKESPVLNRVMWIVFTLAGVAVGLWTFSHFGLSFVD